MKYEKIFPKRSKIIGILIATMAALALLCILAFGSRFNYFNKTWEQCIPLFTRDMIILAVAIALTVAASIMLSAKNYYVITKDSLVHHRMYDELYYNYKDILYIDEEYTHKKETLLFYTNKGDQRFLVLDKEHKIYDALKSNCKNLISREEFHRKFPKVKL